MNTKHLFIIIGALFFCINANSQTQVDTLWVGDRVPNYYYWDTNWWDYYYLNYHAIRDSSMFGGDTHINFGYSFRLGNSTQPELARYFNIDKGELRIIGAAAVIRTTDNMEPQDLKLPEYFRLYDVGLEGMEDSMVFRAEARWDTMPMRHYMQVESVLHNCHYWDAEAQVMHEWVDTYRDVYPVYEAYFDSAITVTDSFYVSGTQYNKFDTIRMTIDMFGDTNYHRVHNSPQIQYTATGTNYEEYVGNAVYPKPPLIKIMSHQSYITYILAEPNGYNPYEIVFRDSLWHPIVEISFIHIFPIFDTSYGYEPPVLPPDSCPVPQGLRASVSQYVAGDATLMWDNNSNAVSWEVAICPEGCLPDEGNILASATTFVNIEGLDTAQWYTAWTRSVCDSGRISEWSDSTRFYIPGSNQQGNEEITTVTDRYTSIYPNPASNTVNILSSFRLKSVEIFDLNGKLLVDRKIGNSIKTTLHIADLDAGTYMVRINTENGTTYKKLIVK